MSGNAPHEAPSSHEHGSHGDGPSTAGAPHRRPAASGGHGHGHDHGSLKHSPLGRLVAAFALTVVFMLVEAAVGIWSGSRALLADASHMLGDAAALGLAMVAQRVAARARTRERTYGFRRAEVLAAFVNGIALAVLALWIFAEAVERWQRPVQVLATPMLITAVLGLVVNAVAAFVLSRGTGGKNTNTRAALFHVMSDALGSIGAIAAAVLILTVGWTLADTVASVAIGVLVLYGGWRLIRETTHVLMEGTPVEIDVAELEATVGAVEGVQAVHDLHVWSISDGFDVMTVHVVVEPGHHGTIVVAAVREAVRTRHKIDHVTVQPEPATEPPLVAIDMGPSPGA